MIDNAKLKEFLPPIPITSCRICEPEKREVFSKSEGKYKCLRCGYITDEVYTLKVEEEF